MTRHIIRTLKLLNFRLFLVQIYSVIKVKTMENGSNTQSNGGDQPLRSAMNNYTGKNVYHHKIVLLGDMGVGKTCISIR